ncbi:MAG: anhydro-N-acetylmuramic acid kinase [Myxococcota bacterium]|jgi:anhydro-N-acetylmuramic acid kinase
MPATRPRFILGMSSGTSADAIDLALVRIIGSGQQRQVSVECSAELPFDPQLQAEVHAFVMQFDRPLAALDRSLANFFGATAKNFLEQHDVAISELTCVASHGQTVFHHDGDPRQGSLQLGDLQIIANICGAPVIGDFRQADLHAGGQGAPVSVFADWVLHEDQHHDCAILNLGGISNISYLRPQLPPLAWDCGPANGPLDALMRRNYGKKCDIDGEMSAKGAVNHKLLRELKDIAYFALPAPKSTGLEIFGHQWVDSICRQHPDVSGSDMLATFCEIASYGVRSSLEAIDLAPTIIYLCGGGRHNPALVGALARNMPNTEFADYSKLGFDADLREAVAFALLADANMLGETATWPSTTGAKKSSILGNLVHPCT